MYYVAVMNGTFRVKLCVHHPVLQDNTHCIIMKTYLYNFDPLKPHFYIVKLGFTGVYIILFISARKQSVGTR